MKAKRYKITWELLCANCKCRGGYLHKPTCAYEWMQGGTEKGTFPRVSEKTCPLIKNLEKCDE